MKIYFAGEPGGNKRERGSIVVLYISSSPVVCLSGSIYFNDTGGQ